MLIRHKITIWFIVLSGLLLCSFSVFIYLASSNSRKQLFQVRIKNKALATQEIYDANDKVAEKIITSIPEQSEYVFDAHDNLVFAINNLQDYVFDKSFFKKVSAAGEIHFEYALEDKPNYKEGYAFVTGEGSAKHTIVITAYNQSGFEQLDSLATILIVGNLFFLIIVGFAGYLFAGYAFRPVNDLVAQAESVQVHDMNFRLKYDNPKNEIGVVANAFNKVLERIQSLAASQKSFISFASHELRTPLAAVSGILETSLSYDKDIQASQKSQRAAQKEIQRAIGLVNGLLQLAKIESINGNVEKGRLNIVDVLIDCISFYKLKNKDQEFHFDVEKIPKEVYIEVVANDHLIRTALINLIDNAAKYSTQKKIGISLSLISTDKISIRIIDEGIGVLEEDLNHIIKPLFRGKNTSGIEGFGLGLALTQRIITLHEGELHLIKNKDDGMTAEIILPASING